MEAGLEGRDWRRTVSSFVPALGFVPADAAACVASVALFADASTADSTCGDPVSAQPPQPSTPRGLLHPSNGIIHRNATNKLD